MKETKKRKRITELKALLLCITNFLHFSSNFLHQMAHLPNLNSVSEKFSAIPNFPKLPKTHKSLKIVGFLEKQSQLSSHQISLTRRLALTSLVSVALFGNAAAEIASANEYWLDGPLPVPSAYNSKLSAYALVSLSGCKSKSKKSS